MDLETRRVLAPKMLKLINFLRKTVSNIEIEGCHVIGEKDEKLEQLHFEGRQRLRAENLGSRYDPSSVRRVRAIKKTPPPIPLWLSCDNAASGTARNASDRPVDYLSVCRAQDGPKLPSLFMQSAFALGFGIARRVPLGWQTAWAEVLAVIPAPTPYDGSGAARWRD